MINENNLISVIDEIESKIKIIDSVILECEDIDSTFLKMEEYYQILDSNYKKFNSEIRNVVLRMNKLNDYVNQYVLGSYHNIYMNINDKLENDYSELCRIENDLNK